MSEKYIYIYNNLINFTRNKQLYKSLNRKDNFSDRLTLFLLHFSFFLKNFKNEKNRKTLQEIYDYNLLMASWPIRTRSTIGGNLCNASPIADMTCLLLALECSLLLTSSDGHRRELSLIHI